MIKRPLFAQILLYTLLTMAVLAFMIPIVWVILLSIRPAITNRTVPPTLIFKPTLKYFYYCFVNPGMSLNYLISSLIIAFAATALSLPFSIVAAYAFSRFKFTGRKFLMFYYLSLFLGPPIVFLIPYFLIMSRIGWVGTYQSMIVVYQTFTIPFSILIIKSFFDEVPVAIEEAAMVDGANRLSALVRVIIPISLPGIIVSSMFAFVFSWNNAVFPLVLSGHFTKPLPVGTLNFFATTGVMWNYIGATSIVTMLPPMLIFLALGKYVVRGLTFGAVKG
ncbi:MAG: carbohydrate ABC transporter permease [Candidatus Aerophobus sp.]|nr:MAG: carbohydrate ABC transporter permease [Candidatus Aerophobus sp.]